MVGYPTMFGEEVPRWWLEMCNWKITELLIETLFQGEQQKQFGLSCCFDGFLISSLMTVADGHGSQGVNEAG